MTRRIDPDRLPWIEAAEGVRYKSIACDDSKIRLLEFAPGFIDTEWCHKAHIGYVLEGTLEIAFTEGSERFTSGDTIAIRAGDAHRARVMEGPVKLFLVEDEQN